MVEELALGGVPMAAVGHRWKESHFSPQVSLMMNFQPPSKAWRASQMITFFIFLLFFPSFTGVLCTLAITIWR